MPTVPATHPRLDALDKAAVKAAAEDYVRRALKGVPGNMAKLRTAVRVINEAEAILATKRPARDRHALSFALYGNGRAVSQTAGVSRTLFDTMVAETLALTVRDDAGKVRIRPELAGWRREAKHADLVARARECGVEDTGCLAVESLPLLAIDVADAEWRIKYATKERDKLIRALIAPDRSNRQELADITGTDPTNISRILALKE